MVKFDGANTTMRKIRRSRPSLVVGGTIPDSKHQPLILTISAIYGNNINISTTMYKNDADLWKVKPAKVDAEAVHADI